MIKKFKLFENTTSLQSKIIRCLNDDDDFDFELFKLLVKDNLNIKIYFHGNAPLINYTINTIFNNNYKLYQIVEYLINEGVDLELTDSGGHTALTKAADKFYYNKLIKLLIQSGSKWLTRYKDFYEILTVSKNNHDLAKKTIRENYPTEYKQYMLQKRQQEFNI